MAFCVKCGKELEDNWKFCGNCGAEIRKKEENKQNNINVFEGNVHKCPNCGAKVDSFNANCKVCGHEFRDTKTTNSIKEFALKLENIDNKEMPKYEGKKSFLKSVVGWDFTDTDEYRDAHRHFEKQKIQQKISIINNFPIPNAKEDILEFMLLIANNFSGKNNFEYNTESDTLNKVWIKKFEQAYERAHIVIHNEDDLIEIEKLYEKYRKTMFLKKNKESLGWLGYFAVLIILFIVISCM